MYNVKWTMRIQRCSIVNYVFQLATWDYNNFSKFTRLIIVRIVGTPFRFESQS